MKGINFITDENNHRKAIVIELETIEQHPDEVEDLIDVIVAESRKNESKRSWDDVKRSFKEKGKL